MDTNAPSTSTSFCHHLYKRAKNVMDGRNDDETLLPVIFEAPMELDWTSEEAAKAANPSIPAIITWDQLRPRLAKAKETPEDEAEYRRLFLSQQVQQGSKWLDVAIWDLCTQAIDPDTLKDAGVCRCGYERGRRPLRSGLRLRHAGKVLRCPQILASEGHRREVRTIPRRTLSSMVRSGRYHAD